MLLLPLLLLSGYAHVKPTVEPGAPVPAEAVVVRFVADRTREGTYRAEATLKGCGTRASRTVNAPAKGRAVRLRIRPPRAGWCVGSYKATVWFRPAQHCPPTIDCGGVAERAVGSTRFTVSP